MMPKVCNRIDRCLIATDDDDDDIDADDIDDYAL
jgi:hypothetical protein